MFWNGVLSNLNDNLLVFVMSAAIRLRKKVSMRTELNSGIEDVLMLVILVVIPIAHLAIAAYLKKHFQLL